MSSCFSNCKLTLHVECVSRDQRALFCRPDDGQLQRDIFVDAMFTEEIGGMNNAITKLVAEFEKIAARGRVPDGQDAKVAFAAD